MMLNINRRKNLQTNKREKNKRSKNQYFLKLRQKVKQ